MCIKWYTATKLHKKQIKNDMPTGDGIEIHYSTIFLFKPYVFVRQIMHYGCNCTRKPGQRGAILSSSELPGHLHKKGKADKLRSAYNLLMEREQVSGLESTAEWQVLLYEG